MKSFSAVEVKHKKILKKLAENGGNFGEAILAAGYSKSTSLKPTRITRTKSWQSLVQEYLPDELIATKHRQLLDATRKIRITKNGDVISEYEEMDVGAVVKGIDMAYKLKGSYKNKVEVAAVQFSLKELFQTSKGINN